MRLLGASEAVAWNLGRERCELISSLALEHERGASGAETKRERGRVKR